MTPGTRIQLTRDIRTVSGLLFAAGTQMTVESLAGEKCNAADKSGRRISELRRADFEIVEENK